MGYFSQLNYTLANEDSALEMEVLRPNAQHALAVAGSGARVLPLLAKRPQRLTCVDRVQEQLYLTELRIESARALEHWDFLRFWGYPPSASQPGANPASRRVLFRKIRLSKEARAFCEKVYDSHNWHCILYTGKWERTFAKLARINRFLTGRRGRRLFEHSKQEDQLAYLHGAFPRRAWNTTVRLLGNAGVFNAMLYKGDFPQKNMPGSRFDFYRNAFMRLFERGLARENFFLQLVFFGHLVFPEGNPVECQPAVYAQIQEGLAHTEVSYECGDVLEKTAQLDTPADFLSLSDVPSYFKGARESGFLQQIRGKTAQDGVVLLRSYMHAPENMDTTGFTYITQQHRASIAREKTQVYLVDVLQKREGHESVYG